MHKGLPVLRGHTYPLPRGQIGVSVYCPFCNRFHDHCADDLIRYKNRPVHRVAHCSEGPLVGGGYYIAMWRSEDKKHMNR